MTVTIMSTRHTGLTDQIHQIMDCNNYNPHAILGLHPISEDEKVIRLWRPGAADLYLEVYGSIVQANKIHHSGLFEYTVPSQTTLHDYRIFSQNGMLTNDPYAFWPTFGDVDQYLFAKGVHYQLYKKMGGRLTTHQGVDGAKFTVWAPNATSVSVVGDMNNWDGRLHQMRSLGASGVWEIFIPGLEEGVKYKFEIHSNNKRLLIKADPYALYSELRPATSSILMSVERFEWHDQAWMEKRQQRLQQSYPMSIYEVHLGSWKKNGEHFFNYRALATALAQYCKEMGFNYIELLPVQEHPLDESWGYQVSGYYAVTSRFGTPEDFQYFVNYMHQHGIGVILDWVPGHFPQDDFSLSRYDGSALYEHSDPRQGWHPHWHTHIFNFGRHEVSNFLIANALFWCQEMHIDGLRVDAVASMLYLDYGRNQGEWIPNKYGGKENLEAIEFIKHLNSVVHAHCPGVLTIAEESTSFTGVTHSIDHGGLGFDLKWNMGWMNDTLRYFNTDPLYRHYHHNQLTFGLIYAFSERFSLVFSHDEVVHGKQSLLGKMPGDYWQKFANLRLLFSYMICQPGKKLLFMGGEIGEWHEWSCKQQINWDLLQYPIHKGLQQLVKDLNFFYAYHAALWEDDFSYATFQWVDFADYKNSVISYLRCSNNEKLLCVHNFTPTYHPHYFVALPDCTYAEEVFNTDDIAYGGSGKVNRSIECVRNYDDRAIGLNMAIAPLATMIFKIWQ